MLHDLVLGDAGRRLSAVHRVSPRSSIKVLDESYAKRATAILVASELGWMRVSEGLPVSTREAVTYQWQFRRFRHYQTGPHRCHGSGRWARTEFQHARPCQS